MILTAAALFFVSTGTATLSAATGMGGGVLLFVSILHFFPLAVTIPVHGFAQLFANLSRTFALRRYLIRAMCLPYLIGSVLGVVAVLQILHLLKSEILPYSIILVLILYSLFKPAKLPDLKLPLWAFGILGFFAGFFGILIGAVDPFLSPFFIRDDLSKEQVVANKSFMQLVIHLAKLPVFLGMGFAYQEYAGLLGLLVVGSLVGTYLGVRALDKINPRIFLFAFKFVLCVIGLRIMYRLYTLVIAA